MDSPKELGHFDNRRRLSSKGYMRTCHIHLVSDPTGETVHQAARAAIAQFPKAEVKEHIWTLVRTTDHVELIEKSLAKTGGLLLLSVVNPTVRRQVERACVKHTVPHLSLLDPVVNMIGMVLASQLIKNQVLNIVLIKLI